MNVSKKEQRTLHALAQGGRIEQYKDDKGDIIEIDASGTYTGDTCAWSPTMQLFRQDHARRWEPVLASVSEALRARE